VEREETKQIVLGEGDNASFSGRVLKSGGEVYPNARLILESSIEKDGELIENLYGCYTDTNGNYRIENIRPGTYSLSVRKQSDEEELYAQESLQISGSVRQDITVPQE